MSNIVYNNDTLNYTRIPPFYQLIQFIHLLYIDGKNI